MKTITVMTKNRTGLLSEISYILGKSRISLEGLDVDVIGEKAVISLTVKRDKKASKILKNNNYEVFESTGLIVRVLKNGEENLDNLTSKLAEEGIKVQDSKVILEDSDQGVLCLDVNRPRKANRVLERIFSNGYRGQSAMAS